MNTPHASQSPAASPPSWPFFRLALPADADDEGIGRLAQAAADHGALGTHHEQGSLLVYLPRAADADFKMGLYDALGREAHELGWEFIAPQIEALDDAPWATAWKERFHSFPLGEKLLIRPDWEMGKPAPEGEESRLQLFLRPGLGFGTGHHETTRLALGMLEAHLRPGDAVLDCGSGSGVLSIAALLLGAGRVAALEFDPEANQNALENFEINGVAGRVDLVESNTPRGIAGPFNLIVCNMIPQHALPLLPDLMALFSPVETRLILTGFLADQKDEVEGSLRAAGLTDLAQASEGIWGGMFGRRRAGLRDCLLG